MHQPLRQTTRRWFVHPGTTFLGLYLAAIIAIWFQPLPHFAYNWENYTLWQGFAFWSHPSLDAFDLTDGLMTDSGRSWWVLVPSWIAFQIGDENLTSLRAATGAIAAAAVPLTWLLGRELIAGVMPKPEQRRIVNLTALLASIFLMLLPSWLLYARTATVVGLSVTPALLTLLIIIRLRRFDRWWTCWLVLLQLALLVNAWAYAPIRFFYLLALVHFVVECIFDFPQWRRYAIAALVTFVTLPCLLAILDQEPTWNPLMAIAQHYNARGEQLFSLRADPDDFRYYVRDATSDQTSASTLERTLLRQNIGDLAKLLLNVDTRPALSDYWNARGQLYPWFFAPLIGAGIVATVRRLWDSPESRLLLLVTAGFTLPMIATSRVHIGRLIFAVPLLCLLAALGAQSLAALVTRGKRKDHAQRNQQIVVLAVALLLMIPTGMNSVQDAATSLPSTPDSRLADLLIQEQPAFSEAGGVVWIRGGTEQRDVEAIGVAATRIEVFDAYQFVNVGAGEIPDPHDPRPIFRYGGGMDLLQNDTFAAEFCQYPWIIWGDLPISEISECPDHAVLILR